MGKTISSFKRNEHETVYVTVDKSDGCKTVNFTVYGDSNGHPVQERLSLDLKFISELKKTVLKLQKEASLIESPCKQLQIF
jgi:hypothetical protein